MCRIVFSEENITEILKHANAIRHLGKQTISNYYNQCRSENRHLKCWRTPEAMVFEWDDGGVKRIFFYSANADDLICLFRNLENDCVIDFITKDRDLLQDSFEKGGFSLYLQYGRFSINWKDYKASEIKTEVKNDDEVTDTLYDKDYGEMALESDAVEIDRLLRDEFDVNEAHFWSLDKLIENIRKGWVWIARRNGKIVAANLFELKGNTFYGAYGVNKGGIDVICSLNKKMGEYLDRKSIKYSYIWMRLNNKRAIRYNVKINGYQPDGLYDMIYRKE